MRVAPLMPAAWLLLVAISATAQPAERPAPQLPAGLAPSIRIHDGDTSIEVQCSVRDRHRQVNASDNGEVLLLLGATVYAAASAPVTSAQIANACARTARYSVAGR
jgi:hypothetical protein